MEQQLQMLFSPKSLIETPSEWITYYPRYLKAIAIAQRLPAQGGKDDKSMAILLPQGQRLSDGKKRYPGLDVLCPTQFAFAGC